MNFKFPKITPMQLAYIALAILVLLYVFKMYKNKEKFDQQTSTKIDNVVKLLNNKEFSDYLRGLNNLRYFDDKLGKYENFVYLRKMLMDKKLTRDELVTYFD